MAKQSKKSSSGGVDVAGIGGFLGGLGSLIEKLGELSEKGEELKKSGEFQSKDGKMRGVYGFNIKVGLGDEGLKVEPFGNLGKDEKTGRPVVQEIREPLIDVFEEEDHVLVVAEMPGVSAGDIQVELQGDILTIAATKGEKKYRKEVLLPAAFTPDKMTHTCRNGVLEVKLVR
jgi:HSP20 family protein